MDILEQLKALEADHSAAQNLLEEAKASVDSLSASLKEKDGILEAVQALVYEKDNEISALKEAISGKSAEVEEALEAVKAMKAEKVSAESKAVEIVAAQGISPISVETMAQDEPMTKAQAQELFANAKCKEERAEVYAKYRDLLIGK